MFGVSPAWFLSLYGDEFSCEQAADSFTLLQSLGFTAWQPEIFLPNGLTEWESAASAKLHQRAEDFNLTATQFIAHFLLHSFDSVEALQSDWGIHECEGLLGVLQNWPEIHVITIPIPTFHSEKALKDIEFKKAYLRLLEKLSAMARMIESSGRRCSLEIVPHSLLGGSEGFLRLIQNPGLENLGLNLDTGHFNTMGERLDFTLGRAGFAVTGTHLCDNDGIINNSYEPGCGTVDWTALKEWYACSDYKGCWDIEIRCNPDETRKRYEAGLHFIKNIFNQGDL